jgi:nucleoside-diphosphate-sugar epimerase
MDKILVTGACGQLGSELTLALRKVYGDEQVIAADKRDEIPQLKGGPYEVLDVLDEDHLMAVVKKHKITEVYHLVAMLSATAEKVPLFAWDLNMKSLLSVLEMAKEGVLKKVYWPSSIAVFGPTTPRENTPQNTIMDPNTVYGISKQAGERWCEYYHQKYGVDVRSIRYPGLIGYKSLPGGGTTDYAVDIYFKAKNNEDFTSFLKKDTYLPMMYMDDAVRATIELMQAPSDKIKVRSSYNLSAMSFTPEMIYKAVCKHYPDFKATYKPDFRQPIADSWPKSINDSDARQDWGWQHEFDLERMTEEIFKHL